MRHPLEVEKVRLVVELWPEPLPLQANENELQQVITNLILNARDAVLEGDHPREIFVRTKPRARLEIQDAGPGVPETLRARIFEPFFTTKPVGKGTGLGLSVSQEILAQHDGKIFLEPPSTFVVEL